MNIPEAVICHKDGEIRREGDKTVEHGGRLSGIHDNERYKRQRHQKGESRSVEAEQHYFLFSNRSKTVAPWLSSHLDARKKEDQDDLANGKDSEYNGEGKVS